MKKGKRLYLFLAMALVILAQLACQAVTGILDLGKVDCESKGGKWRQEVDPNGELDEWCEMPSKQQPTATQPPVQSTGCFPPRNAYHWAYDEHHSSSGTGGVACNARFIFDNRSAEPQRLVIYTAWDNNKMKDNGWDSYSVPAGKSWEKRVNRTIYKNGIITFNRVERLLVVRDVPECVNIIPSTSQATEWEAQAEVLNEIPCP